MKRSACAIVVTSALVAACASGSKEAAPARSPAGAGAAAASTEQDKAKADAQPAQPGYAQPGPPPPPQARVEAQSTTTTPATGATGGATTSRSVAIQQANRDIDSAQRELDVAGGDCRNACRALGSMDRAAGRLCVLTRDEGTPARCDDAKARLFAARDRVRNTCGSCPDGQPSVDRNAPVPSMH